MSLFDLLTMLALLPALATGVWMIRSASSARPHPEPPSPRPRFLRHAAPASSAGRV